MRRPFNLAPSASVASPARASQAKASREGRRGILLPCPLHELLSQKATPRVNRLGYTLLERDSNRLLLRQGHVTNINSFIRGERY